MADMYGAIRSNEFKVRDVASFLAWFTQFHFGYAIEVWADRETREVSFGGYEQYPTAYPRVLDGDGYYEEVEDLTAYARAFAAHLEPGEVVNIVAGGHEKLRYVSFDQLLIAADHPDEFIYRQIGSHWDKDLCLKLIEEGSADPAA